MSKQSEAVGPFRYTVLSADCSVETFVGYNEARKDAHRRLNQGAEKVIIEIERS